MRQHQTIDDKGPKVPAYIVTFSDMVTLLLTFFVMLLSLATVQDQELFDRGRGSFVQSLKYLGLGMLSGAKPTLDFSNIKVKYSVSNPDESFEGRTIHAKEEEIRSLFNNLSRSMNTMPSQIVAKYPSFSVTNIRFPRGVARLDESARRFLTEFCLHLQQDSGSKPVKLYVLGLAGDETTEKEQWMLSAERAQAVADFLQGVLPLGPGWRVYSWGAGPGGDWVREDSPISKQSQILIAILRQGD
ncbi:MAG: flagellar motor protein MotB [Planctomycetota bacterium]|jgi:chemotaxis protein MotB